MVSVFYRNYKTFEGLQIPSLIETGAGPGVTPDKMVIDNVMLNAPVDERAFAKPGTHERRGGMAMGGQSRSPMPGAPIDPSTAPANPGPPGSGPN